MTNENSQVHYVEAEKLLKEAESHREPDTRAEWCLELARMHLDLYQASIAAQAPNLREAPAGASDPFPAYGGAGASADLARPPAPPAGRLGTPEGRKLKKD